MYFSIDQKFNLTVHPLLLGRIVGFLLIVFLSSRLTDIGRTTPGCQNPLVIVGRRAMQQEVRNVDQKKGQLTQSKSKHNGQGHSGKHPNYGD
jgi:hypothetical protein